MKTEAKEIFFRGEHPDTRSAKQFLSDMQKAKSRIWYPIRRQPGRTGYRVRCKNTGRVYSSIREAANDLKLDNTNLGRHLAGHIQHSHVKGYKFELI